MRVGRVFYIEKAQHYDSLAATLMLSPLALAARPRRAPLQKLQPAAAAAAAARAVHRGAALRRRRSLRARAAAARLSAAGELEPGDLRPPAGHRATAVV